MIVVKLSAVPVLLSVTKDKSPVPIIEPTFCGLCPLKAIVPKDVEDIPESAVLSLLSPSDNDEAGVPLIVGNAVLPRAAVTVPPKFDNEPLLTLLFISFTAPDKFCDTVVSVT